MEHPSREDDNMVKEAKAAKRKKMAEASHASQSSQIGGMGNKKDNDKASGKDKDSIVSRGARASRKQREWPTEVLFSNAPAVNPMSVIEERVVIAMVGLPARGKSYISKAIVHYLCFLGCPVRLFNAGNKRRALGFAGADSSFFDASNADAKKQREQMAMETLDELLEWLVSAPSGCACGIFDATNTTAARRRAVIERCARAEKLTSMPLRLVFVESVCNDEKILCYSYHLKMKNGDYEGSDPEKGLADFISRVREYEKVYETITDVEARGFEAEFATNGGRLRYIQTVDAGSKLIASGCNSFLMSHVVSLLHSIHLYPRKISILLTGESENDRNGIRGGDSDLSEKGLRYSAAMCELVRSGGRISDAPSQVFTGTLRRYAQVVDMLCAEGAADGADGGWTRSKCLKLKALNEMSFGSIEGLPGGKLRHSFPGEFAARSRDPLHYRYPGIGGDSYMDLVTSCREVVLALERTQCDVAIVCDVAVARVLVGYFQGVPIAQIPNIEVAPGVIQLVRSHSGFSLTQHRVDVGCPSMLLAP